VPRGGKRVGRSGAAYAQRTDLNQAPRAVPGQTYGEATQQLEAQRTVPLPRAAPLTPAPPPAITVDLDAPSARPDEPVTAGLATGPGPGPEALGLSNAEPQRLAPYLPVLELAASLPGSSRTLRQFVRTLRGGV